MENLEGKVAFITGGASGIGLGMAKAFCSAGMKVIIADIRHDHLEDAEEEAKVEPGALDELELLSADLVEHFAHQRLVALDRLEGSARLRGLCRGHHVDVYTRSQDSSMPRINPGLGHGARVIHLPAGPEHPYDKHLVYDHLPEFVDGVLAQVRDETGLPVLSLEADMCDTRSYNPGILRERITAFLEMLGS